MKQRVAYLGVYSALALILSYVETLVPIHFAIPGMKLGLANLIIVIMLYQYRGKDAYIVSIIRVILAGFMFSNLSSIIFSLVGCTLSLCIMIFAKTRLEFSILGVSIAGAVFHNLGQVIVAILVVENFSVIYYFPMLMVSGIITGLIIGIISKEVLKRLPKM